MENAGAVFFPAAGNRVRYTILDLGVMGIYWTATYYNEEMSCHFGVSSYGQGDGVVTGNSSRFSGKSVRLVRDYYP